MSSSQSVLLCRYRYDPLDRLINHTRADAPTQQRFYCQSRLATEIKGAMQHSIVQDGNLVLAQQQRLGGEVKAVLLATDLQRSVLHTLEKNDQRQAIAYAPYGHRCTESGLTSLLGFNGERLDPVTGHYLLGNGYRAFNPVLMLFNSPDNLSPFGKGGLNQYAYCLRDPVNFSDVSGHMPLKSNGVKLLNFLKFGRSNKPIKITRLSHDQLSDVRHALKYGHRMNSAPIGRRLSDPGPQPTALIEPAFLGHHGTRGDSALSLGRIGVDPRKSQQRDDPGFYFSPNIEVARYHSKHQNFKIGLLHETSNIVEIHIQNFT